MDLNHKNIKGSRTHSRVVLLIIDMAFSCVARSLEVQCPGSLLTRMLLLARPLLALLLLSLLHVDLTEARGVSISAAAASGVMAAAGGLGAGGARYRDENAEVSLTWKNISKIYPCLPSFW